MKKRHWIIPALTLLLLAALLLPACAEPEPEPVTPPAPAPPTPTTPTAPTPAPPTPAPPTPEPEKPTPPAEPAEPEPTVLKLSYTMPKGKSFGAGFEWFAEEFPKRTEGRYKIETYPSNSLVPHPAALDSVKAGVAEIALFTPGMFASAFPLTQITTLPTLAMPQNTVEEHLAACDNWWEFYNLPEIQTELAGMKLLWPCITGNSNIPSAKKEIRSAADFNGLVVAATGPSAEIVKANGGASIMVVPPEGYMNFDKGLIDAGFWAPAMITDYGTEKLLDYYTLYDIGTGILVLMMNLEAWNAMSPQDQETLEEAMSEMGVVNANVTVPGGLESLQIIEDAGVTIIKPTPEELEAWDRDCQPAIDRWIEDCKAAGVENPEAFLAKYREVRAKHIK